MAPMLDVLAIPGSLRERSFNAALARALVELAPEDTDIEVVDIRPIPLYDGDLDTDERRPEAVSSLKRRIAAADAVIFVSPEYNHGVPGVLKNTIDWVSRPAFRSPMAMKPCGMMGAAPGLSGTMRGQQVLKVVLLGMASQIFPHPGVAVSRAKEKFDEALRLTDEGTRSFVAGYLEEFAAWARRVRQPPTEGDRSES